MFATHSEMHPTKEGKDGFTSKGMEQAWVCGCPLQILLCV